jgi:hypothetical protein
MRNPKKVSCIITGRLGIGEIELHVELSGYRDLYNLEVGHGFIVNPGTLSDI